MVGATVAITWIGATAIGGYGGQLLGDPEALGLDAAFPAGFLALRVAPSTTRSQRSAPDCSRGCLEEPGTEPIGSRR